MTTEEIQKILPNCIISQIKTHSAEWHKFRNKLVNSSELGVLTQVNKYGSPIKLYYEKLGLAQGFDGNEFTFLGTYYENSIRDLWQYHSGTQGSYVKNYEDGRKIRGYIDIDSYISNPKYPWLSGSVDGLIDKNAYHALNLITMDKLEGYGVLECKRMSSWVDRAYDGMPPGYLLQVQSYLAITELEYAEIAVLKEGGLVVEVILPDNAVQDHILAISEAWYNNHLIPGMAAKKELDQALIEDDIDKIEAAQAKIQHYQPDVDDASEDYKTFISDTFNKDREFVKGSNELYSMAKKSVMMKKVINGLEVKRKAINSRISAEHGKAGTEYFSLGNDQELGYTRYYVKGSNKRHELNLKVKNMPEESRIRDEIGKVNFEY